MKSADDSEDGADLEARKVISLTNDDTGDEARQDEESADDSEDGEDFSLCRKFNISSYSVTTPIFFEERQAQAHNMPREQVHNSSREQVHNSSRERYIAYKYNLAQSGIYKCPPYDSDSDSSTSDKAELNGYEEAATLDAGARGGKEDDDSEDDNSEGSEEYGFEDGDFGF